MGRCSRPPCLALTIAATSLALSEGALLARSVGAEKDAAASRTSRLGRFLGKQEPKVDADGEYDGRGVQSKVLGGSSEFEGDTTGGIFGGMFENSATDFRVLDNLDPVAPMDSVSAGQEVENSKLLDKDHGGRPMKAAGIGRLDALYVPPYARPDAFPRVEGDSCICGPASVLNPAGPQCEDGLALTVITTAECPDAPFKLSDCTSAKPGEMCEANGAECGADGSLNNCRVFDVYRKATVPSVALPQAPTSAQMPAWATAMGLQPAKPGSLVLPVVCRCGREWDDLPPIVKAAMETAGNVGPTCSDGSTLTPISKAECPAKPSDLADCEAAEKGAMCALGGKQCGADGKLNNCQIWDVYRKIPPGAAAAFQAAAPAPAAAGAPPGAPPGMVVSGTGATTTAMPSVSATKQPKNKPDASTAFQYYTRVPQFNSSTFYELKPADVTYSNGNYWLPLAPGGLVAPFDRLPMDMYPLQAPSDEAHMVPVTARGDRLKYRFARYMDQVEDRAKACDNVSPECTVDCIPGDQVTLVQGSSQSGAKIIDTHPGNMITVEFMPSATKDKARLHDAKFCPTSSGCNLFEVCFTPGLPCVPEQDKPYRDYSFDLVHNYTCPDGYALCSRIRLAVAGSDLRKGGIACHAAVPPTPKVR
eukprot:TRINITY_DN103904_c0_g1_i1.p1 TRINITY_DN103904_c0_g1~~TRINITY_DN103904_c0_g1_i1.p1  ORF type:complete len:647 (-),score=123.30 TRINITY_DN103904_c0_g1_i1:175-2115(-)